VTKEETFIALANQLMKQDAEVQRLKAEFQKAKEWNQFSEIQIKNLQNIVEAQSDLLTRAADALDRPETRAYTQQWVESLIAELRKAAE
jgi:hypothetical protein